LFWRYRQEPRPDRPFGGPIIQFGEDEVAAAQAAAAARTAVAIPTNLERLSENAATSLTLKASKTVVSRERRSAEEAMMWAEAKRRHAGDPRPADDEITMASRSKSYLREEPDLSIYRDEIAAKVQDMPYLRTLLAGRGVDRGLFTSKDGKAWTLETRFLSDRAADLAYRARISQGFGISEHEHWSRTKGEIRRLLLPRANQLLEIASVRRMLDEALAGGQRALVIGPFVFWYEPDGGLGWIVKEVGSPKDASNVDGEADWEEGAILSKNHGRIVVLPFRKADGERVNGYTRNVSGDGPAKPRHKSQYVEIPFKRLESDLMIGLFGELPYE
jgi:hypothetical protein